MTQAIANENNNLILEMTKNTALNAGSANSYTCDFSKNRAILGQGALVKTKFSNFYNKLDAKFNNAQKNFQNFDNNNLSSAKVSNTSSINKKALEKTDNSNNLKDKNQNNIDNKESNIKKQAKKIKEKRFQDNRDYKKTNYAKAQRNEQSQNRINQNKDEKDFNNNLINEPSPVVALESGDESLNKSVGASFEEPLNLNEQNEGDVNNIDASVSFAYASIGQNDGLETLDDVSKNQDLGEISEIQSNEAAKELTNGIIESDEIISVSNSLPEVNSELKNNEEGLRDTKTSDEINIDLKSENLKADEIVDSKGETADLNNNQQNNNEILKTQNSAQSDVQNYDNNENIDFDKTLKAQNEFENDKNEVKNDEVIEVQKNDSEAIKSADTIVIANESDSAAIDKNENLDSQNVQRKDENESVLELNKNPQTKTDDAKDNTENQVKNDTENNTKNNAENNTENNTKNNNISLEKDNQNEVEAKKDELTNDENRVFSDSKKEISSDTDSYADSAKIETDNNLKANETKQISNNDNDSNATTSQNKETKKVQAQNNSNDPALKENISQNTISKKAQQNPDNNYDADFDTDSDFEQTQNVQKNNTSNNLSQNAENAENSKNGENKENKSNSTASEKNPQKEIFEKMIKEAQLVDYESNILDESGALSAADEVTKLALSENSTLQNPSVVHTNMNYDTISNNSIIKNPMQLMKAANDLTNVANENDLFGQITNKITDLKDAQGQIQGQKLTMVLRPNDLGRLSIELIKNNDGLSTNILAQNDDVRIYIEKNINNLRQQLADAGVNVNNIQIKTQGQNTTTNYNGNYNGEGGEAFGENQNNQQNGGQNNNKNGQNYRENKDLLSQMSNYDLNFAKSFSSILNNAMNYES